MYSGSWLFGVITLTLTLILTLTPTLNLNLTQTIMWTLHEVVMR